MERRLAWPGCSNVRELGGLPVCGGQTLSGAVVRGDALDRLTSAGWEAAWSYGIRTVVDLREPEERSGDLAARPGGLVTVAAPLDGWAADPAFWARWRSTRAFGTPLYFSAFLERFPDRVAAAVGAIARAAPGGVAFHCGAGRDRAGLVAAVVLRAVGVRSEVVADDYALSHHEPDLVAYLAGEGLTARSAMLRVLRDVNAQAYLLAGGLGRTDLERLESRLVPRSTAR